MRATRHDRELRRYLWRVLEVCFMLAFIVVFALLLGYLMQYILPFVIGWVVAILLIPIVHWLERLGMPRLTAVLVVMLFMLAVVVALSLGVIFGIAREANSFKSFFYTEGNWIQQKLFLGQAFYGQMPPQVADTIQSGLANIVKFLQNWLQTFGQSMLSLITKLPELLFIGVIAVVTSFFILLRHERMMVSFFRLVPPGWDKKLNSILNDMSRAFLGSIRVQFILMCLSAVLGVIGMFILHIQYAVLLGILFALTGLIPILGSALLTVPWALGALLLGDVSMAIKVIGLQVVISLIRHMVEPKILADSVGLDTLTTLFALYVGLRLMGVVGLFIGPIILIGAKGLLRTHLFVDFLPHFASEQDDGGEPGDT